MLGMNYGPDHDPLAILKHRDRGAISVYAKGEDYHEVIKPRLKDAGALADRAGGGDVKVFVDTAAVMEKPLAAAAGIGWQGKHTNLVSREFGSWLFLGAIFTTLELPADEAETDHCGTCQACLDVCPTAAFPAPYRLDARRCISYLTIEHKGPIPRELRPLIGNRIYGCDDCLAVCPWNKFAQQGREAKLAARGTLRARRRLPNSLGSTMRHFARPFAKTAVKRTGRDRFVRNVLIAVGNSGDPCARRRTPSGCSATPRRWCAAPRCGRSAGSIRRGLRRLRRRMPARPDADGRRASGPPPSAISERDRLRQQNSREDVMAHRRTHAPHHAGRTCRGRSAPPRARVGGLAGAQHLADPWPDRRRRRRRQRAADRRRPVAQARPADRGRAKARRGRHAGGGADGARHARRLSARLDSERPRRHAPRPTSRCPTIRSTTSRSSARRSNFPFVIVTYPDHPIRNIPDLIKTAKVARRAAARRRAGRRNAATSADRIFLAARRHQDPGRAVPRRQSGAHRAARQAARLPDRSADRADRPDQVRRAARHRRHRQRSAMRRCRTSAPSPKRASPDFP